MPIVATVVAVAIIRWSPCARRPPLRPSLRRIAEVVANAGEPPHADRRPAPAATPAHVVPRRIVAAPVADEPRASVPRPCRSRRSRAARSTRPTSSSRSARKASTTASPRSAFPARIRRSPASSCRRSFELPEGYVRHYQSTDDGEQLPAILMFHPDYEFVDEQGQVVPLARRRRRPARDGAAGLRHESGARRSRAEARRTDPLSAREPTARSGDHRSSPDAATLSASRACWPSPLRPPRSRSTARAAWPWVALGWVGLVPWLCGARSRAHAACGARRRASSWRSRSSSRSSGGSRSRSPTTPAARR